MLSPHHTSHDDVIAKIVAMARAMNHRDEAQIVQEAFSAARADSLDYIISTAPSD
jgi:hypothetical protein